MVVFLVLGMNLSNLLEMLCYLGQLPGRHFPHPTLSASLRRPRPPPSLACERRAGGGDGSWAAPLVIPEARPPESSSATPTEARPPESSLATPTSVRRRRRRYWLFCSRAIIKMSNQDEMISKMSMKN
ncbi:hypothetical protein PVAP13_2NG198106 [Panicum virgatum]|uniref:Uncharacterized protein n=1 Tax=Panicum virgatum TaxID=38727 RepID=A0A8T0VL39_PANVG|nr:hypothetical protein PVAP13_2NG198106 [Panicum virgatum]